MAESEFLVTFMLSFSLLLVVISAVQRYTRNFIIPGVTILMFLGAILTSVPNVGFKIEEFYKFIEKIPDVILLVIIPILIFESGRKLKIGQIKKEAIPIGFFAIIGVIITIIIIGIGVTSVFHIPIIDALLFGAILAATDPVAVSVIFKKFPIPYKLNTIIEGESLFNDATGVISFNVVKGIIFSGVAFSFLDGTASQKKYAKLSIGADELQQIICSIKIRRAPTRHDIVDFRPIITRIQSVILSLSILTDDNGYDSEDNHRVV